MKYRVETHSEGSGKSGASVYREGEEKPLFVLHRNYGIFPYKIIEDHPNGHDYMICGEDYQGQTVLELDTGSRRDFLPAEAKEGFGFCWSEFRFDVASQLLIVEGCIWAAPYEFRFYDFSDPMNGWKEIEADDIIDSDGGGQTWPEIIGTRVKVFQNKLDEHYKASDTILSIKSFELKNNKLVFVSEWVSEEEQKERADRAVARKRYEEWETNFRSNDPLYLLYKKIVEEDETLSPESYESHGITYDGWCPDFKKKEKRWCRRIITRPKVPAKEKPKGYSVDLEWAVDTGPVKLVVYKDGNTVEHKFFEHSVDGMREAFEYAKSLCSKENTE